MKTVFLYAGQGSQREGMGKDFYEAFPEYREVIDSFRLSFGLKKMMHEADGAALSQTRYTQPCMAAFAAGVTAALAERGLRPDGACGLSLGEYGALYAAGVFSRQDYLRLVEFRGAAMGRAADELVREGRRFAMSAVMGLPAERIESLMAKGFPEGYAVPVNYNCPGQCVICGEEAGVAAAEKRLKEAGAKRFVRLAVSGPFHTKYMEKAGNELKIYLDTVRLAKPAIPVALNRTGRFLSEEDDLKALLVQQLQKSVRFEEGLRRFLEAGADVFVEIGPGNVLTGFVKKTAKDMGITVTALSVDKAQDMEAVMEKLA